VNTIDPYHFGEIISNGKKYSSDVVIFPDRVQGDWWRNECHELSFDGIARVMAESPAVLIVCSGTSGLMKVLLEVPPAVEALHVTC
jgi:hypothetical protein